MARKKVKVETEFEKETNTETAKPTEEVKEPAEEVKEPVEETKEPIEETKPAKKTTKKKAAPKKATTKKAEKVVEKKEVEEVPFEEAEPAKPEDLLKTPTQVAEQIEKMMKASAEGFDPYTETKEDKFHRIASARVSKVLDSLRILGHCSNLNTYEYTEEEVDKMFTAIRRKLDNIENNFREKLRSNQEVDFKF